MTYFRSEMELLMRKHLRQYCVIYKYEGPPCSISDIAERSTLREIVSAIHRAVCSGDGIVCVACVQMPNEQWWIDGISRATVVYVHQTQRNTHANMTDEILLCLIVRYIVTASLQSMTMCQRVRRGLRFPQQLSQQFLRYEMTAER